MEKYVEGGWVTATKYEDELRDMLKERTGGNKEKARSGDPNSISMQGSTVACDVLRVA